MGIFKKLLGKKKESENEFIRKKIEHLKEMRTKIGIDDNAEDMKLTKEEEDFFTDQEKALKKIKVQNNKWKNDLNQVTLLRSKAKKLEDENKLNDALSLYKESFTFGKNSANLNFSNYGHDIDRIIVLLGKTKQKDELVRFLEEIIERYPDRKDIAKWKERLSKLV